MVTWLIILFLQWDSPASAPNIELQKVTTYRSEAPSGLLGWLGRFGRPLAPSSVELRLALVLLYIFHHICLLIYSESRTFINTLASWTICLVISGVTLSYNFLTCWVFPPSSSVSSPGPPPEPDPWSPGLPPPATVWRWWGQREGLYTPGELGDTIDYL